MIHTTIGQQISMAEHFKPRSFFAQDVMTNGRDHSMALARTRFPASVTKDTLVRPDSQFSMPPQ